MTDEHIAKKSRNILTIPVHCVEVEVEYKMKLLGWLMFGCIMVTSKFFALLVSINT